MPDDQSRARQEAVSVEPLRGSDVIPKKEESKPKPPGMAYQSFSPGYENVQVEREEIGPKGERFTVRETMILRKGAAVPPPFRLAGTVSVKGTPDVGKFRLPIEYALKNIPAASLDDHKAIKKMLLEIEREVETLKSKPETVRREIEAFTVGYDASNHWLIAKGTESELERLKTILEELDAFPPTLTMMPLEAVPGKPLPDGRGSDEISKKKEKE